MSAEGEAGPRVVAKRGAKPGVERRDPPDQYRCQRVVVLQTAGKWDRWRCGRRVKNAGGYCVPHQTVADAQLVQPLAAPGPPDDDDGQA
jgi:hypothetical protein